MPLNSDSGPFEVLGVSACLIGFASAYDGKSRMNPDLVRSLRGKIIIPICPEVMGGLSTPRIPAEIQQKAHSVINLHGLDVTEAFREGARSVLCQLARHHCFQVILKDLSPSCGLTRIYDGSFTRRTIPGMGVAAQMFLEAHIDVKPESKSALR
jgi:uncharacterized protein YbbK (DUF523 family)